MGGDGSPVFEADLHGPNPAAQFGAFGFVSDGHHARRMGRDAAGLERALRVVLAPAPPRRGWRDWSRPLPRPCEAKLHDRHGAPALPSSFAGSQGAPALSENPSSDPRHGRRRGAASAYRPVWRSSRSARPWGSPDDLTAPLFCAKLAAFLGSVRSGASIITVSVFALCAAGSARSRAEAANHLFPNHGAEVLLRWRAGSSGFSRRRRPCA